MEGTSYLSPQCPSIANHLHGDVEMSLRQSFPRCMCVRACGKTLKNQQNNPNNVPSSSSVKSHRKPSNVLMCCVLWVLWVLWVLYAVCGCELCRLFAENVLYCAKIAVQNIWNRDKHGLKKRLKMMKRTWENTKKTQENIGKTVKTKAPSWHEMVYHGTKNGPKTALFPDALFYTFPGICRRFRPEVLFQTPKNAFWGPRSYSKGHNHALENVLTSEPPGMKFRANIDMGFCRRDAL